FTVVKATWQNQATVSGNLEVGVLDQFGNKISSSGSVSQTPVNSLQSWDPTDFTLSPGTYYLAFGMDNTTGIVRSSNPLAIWLNACGVQEETISGTFGLPATATFSNPSSAFFPYVVLQGLTTL